MISEGKSFCRTGKSVKGTKPRYEYVKKGKKAERFDKIDEDRLLKVRTY